MKPYESKFTENTEKIRAIDLYKLGFEKISDAFVLEDDIGKTGIQISSLQKGRGIDDILYPVDIDDYEVLLVLKENGEILWEGEFQSLVQLKNIILKLSNRTKYGTGSFL